MQPVKYKIPVFIPILAAISLLTWMYLFICYVEIPEEPDVSEADIALLAGFDPLPTFIGMVLPAAVVLFCTFRVKAQVSSTGLFYRGVFRSLSITWSSLSGIEVPKPGFVLRIHFDGRSVRILNLAGATGDLSRGLAESARLFAPHVIDDQPTQGRSC